MDFARQRPHRSDSTLKPPNQKFEKVIGVCSFVGMLALFHDLHGEGFGFWDRKTSSGNLSLLPVIARREIRVYVNGLR